MVIVPQIVMVQPPVRLSVHRCKNTDQLPMLAWAGPLGFETDGVTPDAVESGHLATFRVKYRDWDNDAPSEIYVWVDINDDGGFEAGTERFALEKMAGATLPYSSGVDYTTSIMLAKVGDGDLKYYFEAADEEGAATGAPTVINTLRVLNSIPQLHWEWCFLV